MNGNNIVFYRTNVSPRVYKDSTVLGAYYGPPHTPSEPSSSNVCMLQVSRNAHKWSGRSLQYATPLQPIVPHST